MCRTPIGPQLLSWLLLNPAAQQQQQQQVVAGAAGGSSHDTPLASRTGSEVAAPAAAGAAAAARAGAGSPVDAPAVSTGTAAAVVKQESAGSLLPDSPNSTASQAVCVVAASKGGDSAAQSADAGGSNTASPGDAKPAAAGNTVKLAAAAAAAAPADVQIDGGSPAPADPTAAAAAAKAGSSNAGDVARVALLPANAPSTSISTNTRGVVEVRIVLDGCVFVGQLQEVGRLELARSRLAPALQPIVESEVHDTAPAGARCALCHGVELPGCHADQATATPGTGMSRQSLGPLMPVSMMQQSQQQQDEGVVWVHRQCALWSPEVYPDRRSMLVRCCGWSHCTHIHCCSDTWVAWPARSMCCTHVLGRQSLVFCAYGILLCGCVMRHTFAALLSSLV
jgi:hypothetical protein